MQEPKYNRDVARRVKNLVLKKAEEVLLEGESHPLYKETYYTALKNSIPRTAEIVGEDGGPVVIQLSGAIAKRYGIDASTESNSEQSSEI